MLIDARIPVRFLDPATDPGTCDPARADQALLLPETIRMPQQGWAIVLRLPGPPVAVAHAPGCACCIARTPQAALLTGLFQARARGEVAFFRAVTAILPEPEAAALRALLIADPFLSGCFRQAG